VAGLLAVVLLVAAVGVAAFAWKYRDAVAALGQAQRAERDAREQLVRAETAEGDAREQLLRAEAAERDTRAQLLRAETAQHALRIRAAESLWRDGDVRAARFELDACLPKLRGWEHGYLRYLCAGGEALTLGRFKPPAGCAAFRPDGARLAVGGGDGTVTIFDAASGAVIRRLKGHSQRVSNLAWSPIAPLLVSASVDRTVRMWDPETGKLLGVLEHSQFVMDVAFSPDGKRLATASASVNPPQPGVVRLWEVENWRELPGLRHPSALLGLSFAPDGRLAAATYDGLVRVWSADGTERATL
jgi:hypothetical protein